MGVVGERFKKNEVYVPEVLIAARAMHGGLDVLEPQLKAAGVKPVGTVVLGTVKGDLHDIGKNLVGMMLHGGGLKVVDVGIDAPPEKFVQAAKDNGAQVIAMSALLTTTMPQMTAVVKAVKAAGAEGQDHDRRRPGHPGLRRRDRRRRLRPRRRQRRGPGQEPASQLTVRGAGISPMRVVRGAGMLPMCTMGVSPMFLLFRCPRPDTAANYAAVAPRGAVVCFVDFDAGRRRTARMYCRSHCIYKMLYHSISRCQPARICPNLPEFDRFRCVFDRFWIGFARFCPVFERLLSVSDMVLPDSVMVLTGLRAIWRSVSGWVPRSDWLVGKRDHASARCRGWPGAVVCDAPAEQPRDRRPPVGVQPGRIRLRECFPLR